MVATVIARVNQTAISIAGTPVNPLTQASAAKKPGQP